MANKMVLTIAHKTVMDMVRNKRYRILYAVLVSEQRINKYIPQWLRVTDDINDIIVYVLSAQLM